MARRSNIDPGVLEKLWNSMFEHSYRIGKFYIENQLLSKDYLLEMPPAAITGLTQLTLLKCVERTLKYDILENEDDKLILDLSKVNQDDSFALSEESTLLNPPTMEIFILSDENRPKGNQFVQDMWSKMMNIKKNYHEYVKQSVKASIAEVEQEKSIFEAIVLSAGEPFDYLPDEFQAFFIANGITKNMDFEAEFFKKKKRRQKLLLVRNLLNDISLKVTKQRKFKDFMMSKVILKLTNEE